MKDSGFASVPAVHQYLKMASACGIDYAPLLPQAGISEEVLKDNNKRVTGKSLERLLALIVPNSGDECFGLHTSQYIEPASYSVLGYIAMNCANLKEVLIQIPLFEKIVGDMGVSTLDFTGELSFIRWECNFTDLTVRRHVIENVLASWVTFARQVGKQNDSPRTIFLEHSAPKDPNSLAEYQKLFQCEVLFDQPYSAVQFDRKLLYTPLAQANDQLLETLLDHASKVLHEIDKDQPLVEQVKNLLRLMIKDTLPRKERVAERLGMNSRTLQRKLNEEGTGYQEVLNELRLELATYYLKKSDLSIDDVGSKLGFAEARSFHRSFKQWTGQTAGAFREQL